MHDSELWQEFDKSGEPIKNGGRNPKLGNPEFGEDVYTSVALVWLYRKTTEGIEVLFQRRSEKVDRFAGFWDVAAGGHINYDESVLDAAVREAKEEIGATIAKDMLQLVVITPSLFANNILREFICDYTGHLEDFHFNDAEVSEVKWVKLSDFDKFIDEHAKPPLRDDTEIRELVKKSIIAHGNR